MEELHLPLEELKRWIHALYLFLHGHREITSAHSVDFFTCDHWDNHIKPVWRDELLSATEEQLVEPKAGGSPGVYTIRLVCGRLQGREAPSVHTNIKQFAVACSVSGGGVGNWSLCR